MSNSGSLKKRLGYLRSSKETSNRNQKNKKSPMMPILPGWERTGEYLWERVTEGTEYLLSEDSSDGYFQGQVDRLRFFDLETTGLSGGAGTIAFLAGVGIPERGMLRVHQLFLSDFPGEVVFLNRLLSLFPEDSIWVTYNGKTYDSHLLKTRCLLQGVSFSPPDEHIDLLYPSRTLFRRITGQCNLSVIEKAILGILRYGDIPGSEIPEVYFSFLKTGQTGRLEDVFRHNVQDILSLYHLLIRFQNILERPMEADLVDPAGLGRLLLIRDHPLAEKYLHDALKKGDREAGLILGFYLKRCGCYEEAERVWTLLSDTFGDVIAAVEKAKYLEHRLKQPKEALILLQSILTRSSGLSDAVRADIDHRMKRLEKKAGIYSDG